MEDQFFKKHLVISTLISIVGCFFISIIIGQILGDVVCNSLGIDTQLIAGQYLSATVGKAVAIGVALILVCASGLFHGIKREHGYLQKCRLLCLLMLGIAIYNVVGDAIANRGFAYTQFHLDALIACVLYAFATGVLEELVCRILLFQNMYEKWNNRPSGVWKAALVSSLVFGMCHLLNLPAGLEPTLFQVYYAVIAGIIFAVMYVLSRNIWVCIFSHFLIDFGGAVGYAFMPNEQAVKLAAGMSGIDIGSIIVVAVMTVGAVYALVLLKKHV